MPAIRGGALALVAFVAYIAGLFLTGPGGLSVLTVLSAAVLATMLTGLVAAVIIGSARVACAVTAAPLRRRASGLREKSWCAAFLPQRDPDAPGRSRPRAPSAAPAAA